MVALVGGKDNCQLGHRSRVHMRSLISCHQNSALYCLDNVALVPLWGEPRRGYFFVRIKKSSLGTESFLCYLKGFFLKEILSQSVGLTAPLLKGHATRCAENKVDLISRYATASPIGEACGGYAFVW
jgi:hypothetical protein